MVDTIDGQNPILLWYVSIYVSYMMPAKVVVAYVDILYHVPGSNQAER